MKVKRTDRLASQIVREIADILRRKLSDPRLQWVTLTRADVSPDLRDAKIYTLTLDTGERREQTLTALRNASGFIRRELGRRLEWRVMPELVFVVDEESEQTERILNKISALRQERSTPDGGTEAGA